MDAVPIRHHEIFAGNFLFSFKSADSSYRGDLIEWRFTLLSF